MTLNGAISWCRRQYASKAGYVIVWCSLYLIVIAIASSLFYYRIPLPIDRLTLADVEYTVSPATDPSGLMAGEIWQPLSLPDDWRQRPIIASNLWYQGHMELNVPPGRLWAVLIPALKMNVAVYLNGILLGNGGRFDDPVARNWMTPQIYFIPHGLLRSGDNLIQIRVKSDPPGSGQLSKLEFAPYEELLDAYNLHYMLRITSIEIVTVMLMMMGGLIAILWFVRRQETYYGYYALVVLVWAIHNLNIFIVDIPFSTRLWDWLAFFSIGLYSFLCVVFIHRFLDIDRPVSERLIVFGGLAGGFMLLFVDDELFYRLVYDLWYPAVFAIGFYVLGTTFIAAWQRRSTDLQFLVSIGLVIMLYATHDVLLMKGYVDWQDGYYIQYGAAALLTLFSAILVRRFADTLNNLDILNQDLEKRVDQKRRQIEKSFEQIRAMERQQVIAGERERLSRDMHDGLGGNLVSTLAMIDSGKASLEDISGAIRHALNDLRLMIDSMEMQEDDLATMLGMFRMRIESQLRTHAIELDWQVDDLPAIAGFGPRDALHILRILQEALTNAIRHGRPDRIELVAGVDDARQQVCIRIRDNGQGFGLGEDSNGHGLANMRHRAAEVGARLTISSSASGTVVGIVIPVAGKSAPQGGQDDLDTAIEPGH